MQYEWRNFVENKQGVKLQTDGDRSTKYIEKIVQYETAKERLKRST